MKEVIIKELKEHLIFYIALIVVNCVVDIITKDFEIYKIVAYLLAMIILIIARIIIIYSNNKKKK